MAEASAPVHTRWLSQGDDISGGRELPDWTFEADVQPFVEMTGKTWNYLTLVLFLQLQAEYEAWVILFLGSQHSLLSFFFLFFLF